MTKQNLETEYCNERGDSSFNNYNNNDYTKWLETKLIETEKQLTLTDVVNCVYVVTERDNYGEQLFRGVFANREKAIRYLAEDGLKESNIDEINEIELD